MSKDFDYIVFHKNCPDGIGGLWTAEHYKKGAIYCPISPGEDPFLGNIDNKSILFVDVCPQPTYVLNNVTKIRKLTILDHHKSSKELMEEILKHEFANIEIVFNLKLSGAQIAWDYFFPSQNRPFFIDYIGDRDLWNWLLPFSEEINFAINKHLTLEEMSGYLEDEDASFQKLLAEGTILKAENKREIKTIADTARKEFFIYGDKTFSVMVTENENRPLTSDIGNFLCENFQEIDFAVITFHGGNYLSVSLRGIKDRCPDLSVIAKTFGGGGHPSAAGFRISSLDKLHDSSQTYSVENKTTMNQSEISMEKNITVYMTTNGISKYLNKDHCNDL
jgi:oligoribonuclease NrnB/cAMP/cGMP phosphodiesterase (DHH superfamily)